MAIEGGCYCGQVRYRASGAVLAQGQCHCRECQYFTGGSPNLLLALPADGFVYTKGRPQSFARDDLAVPVTRYFCGTCGTGLSNLSPTRSDAIIIKVGTLDEPGDFAAEMAIFTIDKQPYHHIPDGLPQFPRRPGEG